jgi:hypothetical protein
MVKKLIDKVMNEYSGGRILNRNVVIILFICGLIGIGVLFYEVRAKQTQHELEQEFQSIAPMPGASPIRPTFNSNNRSTHGLVGSGYKTELSYPEIRGYYDNELAKRGWKFEREENVIYRDEYSGGKIAYYRKGRFTAALQYAGERERAEWGYNYGLDLTWGMH